MDLDEEVDNFIEELQSRTENAIVEFEKTAASKRLKSTIEGALEQRQETIQSACMSAKQFLDFGSCQIDDFDAITIGIYLSEPRINLRLINLGSNAFSDEGLLDMLAGMQYHSLLEELYLGNNNFSTGTSIQGLSMILPCFKHLRIIGLGGLQLEDTDIIRLCSSLSQLPSLKHVQLHNNLFTDEGLLCIIALLLSNEIERLYIGQNDGLSEDGIVRFFECVALNTTLKSVHINDIPLSLKSLQAVNLCLLSNDSLEELNLGNCDIDDDRFTALVPSLKANSHLQHFHLWRNSLTYESANVVVEILENYNSHIKSITLYNNDIIDRDLLKNIESLLGQNAYFESTVRNEKFYESKIEELKQKYAQQNNQNKKNAKSSDDKVVADAKLLLENKKLVVVAEPPAQQAKNLKQKLNGTSSSFMAPVESTQTNNKKHPVESKSESTKTNSNNTSKTAAQTIGRPPSSSSTSAMSSNKGIPGTNDAAKRPTTASSMNSKLPGTVDKKIGVPAKKPLGKADTSNAVTKVPLNQNKEKIPPTKNAIGNSNTQKQQSNGNSKNNNNNPNNDNDDDDDDDDFGYVSLSATLTNASSSTGNELDKQSINNDKGNNNNQNKGNKDDNEDEDGDDWLDDEDDEDERELDRLEKAMLAQEESKYSGRLEYIDEFYEDDETDSAISKQRSFAKNVLAYDLNDANTLKWQGFFEDPKTGLLKSKLK